MTTSLELVTSTLTGPRSDQLSYATMVFCFRWHEETRTPMTSLTPEASCRLNDMPPSVMKPGFECVLTR